jgi:hypothetical protein
MAFLNGIFGRQQPAAPAAPQQTAATQGGSAGPASQQQAPANPGANPANMAGAQPPAASPTPSALDSFADLFKPQPVDPAAPKQLGLNDPYLAPIDPAAFKQQVSSANFAANIPAETMQKAMAGDASAFAEAINHATREAFSAATTLSHGLSEHAARQAAERVSGSLDGRIRNTLIRGQNTTNDVLNKPAVAPIFGAVKEQIARNNPQLSPEMVQQSAEQYFMEMSNEITAPQRQAETTKNTPKAPDFSSYLNN